MTNPPRLADDLLPSVAAIALYIYGKEDPSAQRRVRHLIDRRAIPTKKVAGRHESRKSWIDAVYDHPDKPNGKEQK